MDEELTGDVDFDFFEDPGKPSPSRSKSTTEGTVNGKPPIPSTPKSSRPNAKNGEDKSPRSADYSSDGSSSKDSYSSDYDSDEDKKERIVEEVKSVNARLPSADSGGRKNAPRLRKNRKPRSQSSHSEDSDDSYTGSSSAYSDGSDHETKQQSQNRNSGGQKNAWESSSSKSSNPSDNVQSKLSDVNKNRPKSSFRRSSTRQKKGGTGHREARSLSDSSSDSYTSDSESDSNSNSESKKSNSDSEITDVSPLQSVDSSPVMKRRNNKHVTVISAPTREYKLYKELPETNQDRDVQRPAEGTMEFKLLMQAVAELDSEKQKRLKASSRRVMFAPPQATQRRDRNNYTFNDMQVRNIDHENERLLQEIIKKRLPRKRKETQYAPTVRRLPNSAVNRLKDQRRIERENLALLQRLQGIKPTRGLTRNEQLSEYHRQIGYGGAPSTTVRPKTSQSTYRSVSRTRSMSSMSSALSIASSSPSSVRTSSRSRPHSAKKMTIDTRPAWDERW